MGWQDYPLLTPPHSNRCGTLPLNTDRDRVGSGWGTPNMEGHLLMKKKKNMKDQHTKKKNLSKDQDSETTHPASAEPSKFLQACLLHSIIITSWVLVPYLQQRIQKWLYSNIEGMSKSRARARLRKLGLLEVKQKRISGQSSLARIFEFVLLGGGELTPTDSRCNQRPPYLHAAEFSKNKQGEWGNS